MDFEEECIIIFFLLILILTPFIFETIYRARDINYFFKKSLNLDAKLYMTKNYLFNRYYHLFIMYPIAYFLFDLSEATSHRSFRFITLIGSFGIFLLIVGQSLMRINPAVFWIDDNYFVLRFCKLKKLKDKDTKSFKEMLSVNGEFKLFHNRYIEMDHELLIELKKQIFYKYYYLILAFYPTTFIVMYWLSKTRNF